MIGAAINLLRLLLLRRVRYVLHLKQILDAADSRIPNAGPFQFAPGGPDITDAGFWIREGDGDGYVEANFL